MVSPPNGFRRKINGVGRKTDGKFSVGRKFFRRTENFWSDGKFPVGRKIFGRTENFRSDGKFSDGRKFVGWTEKIRPKKVLAQNFSAEKVIVS